MTLLTHHLTVQVSATCRLFVSHVDFTLMPCGKQRPAAMLKCKMLLRHPSCYQFDAVFQHLRRHYFSYIQMLDV